MLLNRRPAFPGLAMLAVLAAGCGTQPVARTDSHIRQDPARAAEAPSIPKPVMPAPLPPPPQARAGEVKYSIVVANQPVRDVLLAIASETKVNVDVHPGVSGAVTINAIDQTLRQILSRIAKQVDMRYEIEGETIHVMPDTPYLHNYRVDYVNMSRETRESVSVATQILSGTAVGGGGGQGDNNSTLRITNTSNNNFWKTLEANIKDMLRETDKLLPEGSSETFVQGRRQAEARTTGGSQRSSSAAATSRAAAATTTVSASPNEASSQQADDVVERRLTFREAASVIVNPEAGVVSVRATSRQHEKVAEFLAQVTSSIKRQVLIEATVVEVELGDEYQSGVDWSAIANNGLGYTIQQSFIAPALSSASNFLSLTYNNPNPAIGGNLSSTIRLLSTFGKTRVLSSPLLMVLNNQSAMLKVTDNRVYFTIKADSVANANTTITNFTSTPNVIPVGLIMNLTPQISDDDTVILNVRPTITSIIDQVQDPNPNLLSRNTLGVATQIESVFPVTRTREMESLLRIGSGQTAILGGLMEDRFEGTRSGVPIVSRIPFLGDLASTRRDESRKKELVIFLRPNVVRNASVESDLARFKRLLPENDYFRDTHPPLPGFQEGLRRLEKGELPDMTPNPVVPEPPVPGASR